MTDIPEKEPYTIEAGTTVKWTKDLSDDYPADEWELVYTFINSAQKYQVTASADGTKHSITIPASTTDDYVAGKYKWIARVTKDDEVYKVDEGMIEITADLAAAGTSTHDFRSHARTVLEAVEAVIEGRASRDQMQYMVQGRMLTKTPIPDLLILRDRYRAEVKAEEREERRENGESTEKNVLVRFD
jgi:hypothetical protein